MPLNTNSTNSISCAVLTSSRNTPKPPKSLQSKLLRASPYLNLARSHHLNSPAPFRLKYCTPVPLRNKVRNTPPSPSSDLPTQLQLHSKRFDIPNRESIPRFCDLVSSLPILGYKIVSVRPSSDLFLLPFLLSLIHSFVPFSLLLLFT